MISASAPPAPTFSAVSSSFAAIPRDQNQRREIGRKTERGGPPDAAARSGYNGG
jgi:hypothetical protein